MTCLISIRTEFRGSGGVDNDSSTHHACAAKMSAGGPWDEIDSAVLHAIDMFFQTTSLTMSHLPRKLWIGARTPLPLFAQGHACAKDPHAPYDPRYTQHTHT